MQHYHNNAKLTKYQREEIQKIENPNFSELAKKYDVSRRTIAKWYKREYATDKSSKPTNIRYVLTEEEKTFVKKIHSKTEYTIEQLYEFTSEIGIKASQSSIYRCVRENIKATKEKPKPKQFKKYDPGFIHIDVTYFPKIEGKKNYLFVAIDRATRAIYWRYYENKDAVSAVDFLDRSVKFFPFKIYKLLTDNGLEFTNRLYKSKKGNPAKVEHIFEQQCRKYNIEHRLTPPYHPQTNGMVERANRTVKENTIHKNNFNSVKELTDCTDEFAIFYNLKRKHHGIIKELKVKTPFEAILHWFEKKPELFHTKPHIFRKKVIYYFKNNYT